MQVIHQESPLVQGLDVAPLLSIPSWPFLSFPPCCCWDTNNPVGQASGLYWGKIWPLGWGMRWVGGSP